MTWIAVNDLAVPGPEATAKEIGRLTSNNLMIQGSIVIEFDFSLRQKAPCKLVSYSNDIDWPRRFTVFLNADYSLSLEAQQGNSRCHAMIAAVNLREAGIVRLTYTWDSPNRSGCLSMDCSEDGAIFQVPVQNPIPFPENDLLNIVSGSDDLALDERTRCLALSDTPVPIGPAPSLATGAMIATPHGDRPIQRLALGELVQTKNNGALPVRWIIQQELPMMGACPPIRLRAPFFGLTEDLVVAGNQRVLISGGETEYYFDQETIHIEARNLIGHPAASPIISHMTMTFYQVLLDSHEFIQVSGAWAESLYIGHLGHTPEIISTTLLAEVPDAILPIHQTRAQRILHGFERQALLDTLSA